MLKKRSSYTAIFSNYENVIKIKRKIYFRELRTSPDRALVAEKWVLDEVMASHIIGHLTLGDIISFTADEDLKNIKFGYPHGPHEIKEEEQK